MQPPPLPGKIELEIERKFLVRGTQWRCGQQGLLCCQGYLAMPPENTVRVRIIQDQAWLTIKGPTHGISRLEFEYPIARDHAQQMLEQLCRQPLIEKTRYYISWQGVTWSVDEFHGANQGLILAEVELQHQGQALNLPPWVGPEVSHDPRYYNTQLVIHPYTQW